MVSEEERARGVEDIWLELFKQATHHRVGQSDREFPVGKRGHSVHGDAVWDIGDAVNLRRNHHDAVSPGDEVFRDAEDRGGHPVQGGKEAFCHDGDSH